MTTLYRPVNRAELHLVKESGWKSFPPRLPQQPIFYPVTNIEYARKITKEWNVPAYGTGFILEFDMSEEFLKKYSIENVGGEEHNELWVPAEELDEFNKNIIGEIRLVEIYEK
jgi:hypothetical protein